MNLEVIKEFIVLSETGSFSEAAETLYLSQPTLSKHMKSLEQELGVRLFERSTRTFSLSRYGRLFLPFAERLLDTREEFLSLLEDARKGQEGSLTLGMVPGADQDRIAACILRFRKENPGMTIHLIHGESDPLKELLRHRQCDLILIRGESGAAELAQEEPWTSLLFETDRLAAVLPSGHPLADRETLKLPDLAAEPLLLLPEGTLMHRICTEACRQAGFEPRIQMTSSSGRSLMEMTGRGMGITLLMKRPASRLLTPDTVLADIAPAVSTSLFLCCRKSTSPASPAGRFMDCAARGL